jgi:hypothetical protein
LAFSNNNVIVNSVNQQDGNFNVRSATGTTVAGVLQAASTGTADIFDLKNGAGATVASFGNTGAVRFKTSTNSTTAFEVQNASGTSIFNVDTTNGKIGTRNETTASTNSAVLTIQSGSVTGTTSNSGNVILGSGNATGTSGNVTIDTGTGATTGTISIGTTNTSGISIGRSGITTTNNGALTVTQALTVNGGSSLQGNTSIATTAGNTATIGNSTGSVTVTGSSASTFVLNGITIDATEFNLLDGHNAALVDTNDAVATAITGVGTITVGTWHGTSIADAYLDNNLTIDNTGSVDWSALNNYPAACGAGQAITQLNDTVTCSSFATGSATDYIQNQNTAAQTNTKFWIDGTGHANTLVADTVIQTPSIDTAGAGALTIGGTNATSVNIGRASGGGAVNITANAASTWKTTTGDLNIQAAGTSSLNLNTGGAGIVNLGTTNTGTINIGGTTATTAVVLQAGASAGNGVAVQSSSATAFRIQNSGAGFTLFTADASATKRVTIGTTATPFGSTSSNGDLMVAGNAEVQGLLYVGNSGSNAIYTSSAGGPLRFKGTARNDVKITLSPEFAGATLYGTGIGTMTASFCSNTVGSMANVGTSICATGQSHNYYEWFNGTQATAQTYSVYTKWQVPSNADSAAGTMSFSGYGWRTSGVTDAVTADVYDASGAVCASGIVLASGTAGWTQSTTTNLSGCNYAANSTLTIKITMTAGQNNYARVGELTINYKSLF